MADAGRTFTATAANDPAFNPVVSLLTNGVDDVVFDRATIGAFATGTGAAESRWFSGAPGSYNGIDFAGNRIDLISMTLGSDLIFDGTSLSVNVTFQVDGAPVPEPSTLLLLGSGLAGLAALKSRNNRV